MQTDLQVGHFHPTWGSRRNAHVADFLQASPIHDDHYLYLIPQAYKCKTWPLCVQFIGHMGPIVQNSPIIV